MWNNWYHHSPGSHQSSLYLSLTDSLTDWRTSLLERLVTLKRTFREKWGPMLELLRTSSRNWYSPAHAFLTGLFVVKQTRQILRLGYCNDLPNSQMFSRILDRSFSLSFSKSQCQHLFKTYERSKYQWVIKIPMSDQNTNEQSKYQQMLSYKVHNTNGQKYQQKKWSKYHFAGIMIIGILNVGILILTHDPVSTFLMNTLRSFGW